ncbi:peptidase M14 [Caballeronia novacaledonica]|uniref:Peptidase M14 n=1 Tax=Caballeronia novacaledonica TaxID=1544861 RepID=A0ACB5QU33_9BURK|nr:peptidase M14 [Caballeronia novacaledonica]
MTQFHAKITGRDQAAMTDIVRKYKVLVARHTVEKVPHGYRVDAHATDEQIRALTADGYTVERLEDAHAAGKARQEEFLAHAAGAAAATLSVAKSAGYLSVDDVEKGLAAAAAAPYADFAKLVQLPSQTWEKRACHALKLGKGGGERVGIYFLGGVHAREWGSPDILLHFVQLLSDAYLHQRDITLGQKTFTAAQIKSIVDTKDIYVFPQANPDGRDYSMRHEAMWRKNRRPAPQGHTASNCVGVDVNRNYDFLWNFPKFFDPAAPVQNSTNPCDHDVYIGPEATSEPETRNAVWMLDEFANIRYFVDLHSYSEDILYNWGDDLDQSEDPSMNFQNPAYDGKRGIANDKAYREYIRADDKTKAVALANTMRDAIKAVRGRVYKTEQALSLYPTAGTSDDYAFSRHIVDPTKPKVFSYTIEWGSPDNPTPFHPPYPEMKRIIDEITCALLAFCVAAE